jgi:hypothetical protein
MNDEGSALKSDDPRFWCFERREEENAFEASVMALLGQLQKRSRETFVSEQNVLRMNHGGNWVHSARAPEPDVTMHKISAEYSIPFKDIAENDLGLIARTMLPLSQEMEKQFAHNMYGVVGAAAEKVGNVVDARAAGSFAQSMLEMFKKIEFGVDRDGNVSLPQIHVGSETFERISKEMQNVPPEIEAEIEQIKAEKIQAALNREIERKAKFRTTDQ